jgi:hypothetical protein
LIWQSTFKEVLLPILFRAPVQYRLVEKLNKRMHCVETLFEILETQKTLDSKARLTMFVDGTKDGLLADILAAHDPDGLKPAVTHG